MHVSTKQKMLTTLETIEARIPRSVLGDGPKPFDSAAKGPWRFQTIAHAQWMCHELRKMVENDCSEDKYNRWVGWIQATLWANGLISIEDCKEDIRNCYQSKRETA